MADKEMYVSGMSSATKNLARVVASWPELSLQRRMQSSSPRIRRGEAFAAVHSCVVGWGLIDGKRRRAVADGIRQICAPESGTAPVMTCGAALSFPCRLSTWHVMLARGWRPGLEVLLLLMVGRGGESVNGGRGGSASGWRVAAGLAALATRAASGFGLRASAGALRRVHGRGSPCKVLSFCRQRLRASLRPST